MKPDLGRLLYFLFQYFNAMKYCKTVFTKNSQTKLLEQKPYVKDKLFKPFNFKTMINQCNVTSQRLADLKPPMFMFIKEFLSRSRLPLLKKEKVNILGCVSMQRIFNGGSSVSYGHLGGDTFLLSMVILLLPFQN